MTYNLLMGADSLSKRNRELSILNAIAESLNRSADLGQILDEVLRQVADLLDLRTGWIWLVRPDEDTSYLAAEQDMPPALANWPERMEGGCYCLDTFLAGDMSDAANINVVTCSRLKHISDGTQGLRYHASIPIYTSSNHLGVLNVASPDWRALSEDELRILHITGDLLGVAIERARLFEKSAEIGALEERNRMAREIHDTLAQDLAGISMQLETAEALLEDVPDSTELQHVIHRALGLTRSSLEEARRSVLDLRGEALEGKSLVAALDQLVDQFRHEHVVEIRLVTIGGSQPIPAAVEIGLYRVAREALLNAVNHGYPERISIRLTAQPDQVAMDISDNGRGFDAGEIGPGKFGLRGIHERVSLLGGHLEIQTAVGSGTQIRIQVPTSAAPQSQAVS
jgi:two-component system NarL family sensor kinase